MRSKVEIIEDAIRRQRRRVERIGELFLSGEFDLREYDEKIDEAEASLEELEQQLDEQLRREDIAINWMGNREEEDDR